MPENYRLSGSLFDVPGEPCHKNRRIHKKSEMGWREVAQPGTEAAISIPSGDQLR
jgi:hypothetical protein